MIMIASESKPGIAQVRVDKPGCLSADDSQMPESCASGRLGTLSSSRITLSYLIRPTCNAGNFGSRVFSSRFHLQLKWTPTLHPQ